VKESFTKKYKKELETAHFVEVNELSVSERGVGGFGSTGMK
jgi:dUTP pyrophosphatase